MPPGLIKPGNLLIAKAQVRFVQPLYLPLDPVPRQVKSGFGAAEEDQVHLCGKIVDQIGQARQYRLVGNEMEIIQHQQKVGWSHRQPIDEYVEMNVGGHQFPGREDILCVFADAPGDALQGCEDILPERRRVVVLRIQ